MGISKVLYSVFEQSVGQVPDLPQMSILAGREPAPLTVVNNLVQADRVSIAAFQAAKDKRREDGHGT